MILKMEVEAVKKFVDGYCETGAGNGEASGKLYSAFSGWMKRNHGYAIRNDRFGNVLYDFGFEKKHTNKGNVWLGIKLKQEVN